MTSCDLATVFVDTKRVTKSRVHCPLPTNVKLAMMFQGASLQCKKKLAHTNMRQDPKVYFKLLLIQKRLILWIISIENPAHETIIGYLPGYEFRFKYKILVMSPSRAGSSRSSSWRIFSSAQLGLWPFSLQREIKNWPKTSRDSILIWKPIFDLKNE